MSFNIIWVFFYRVAISIIRTISNFKILHLQVSKLAGVMVRHGVKKGDTVVIYMPMIPQTMYTMLACARIGAIHSLIFGGFASKELSTRIDHAKVRSIFVQVLKRTNFILETYK